MLESLDYKLVFKEVLRLNSGEVKGNVDAEMVLHAMIEYACLVRYLVENIKLKTVIAPNLKNSSILLRRACDGRFIYLDELRTKLEYKKKETEPRKD